MSDAPTEDDLQLDPQLEQPAEDDSASSAPGGQLQAIIDSAKSARLAPADEDRAVQLLKEAVTGGPKALPVIVDALVTLPWGPGVKAVTEAWPETKPAGRTRLINGLGKTDSDASRRIRLSLARGLYAQDAASAVKLIGSVCDAMGGAKGGSSTKDRQIFANVMLGKARPWIANVAMAEMKPAEAQRLITPTLEACDQSPIFTQIWILRWICDTGKFEVLPSEHVQAIGKSINRWQPRWRKELHKIIPKLPESLEAVLTDSRPSAPQPAAERPAPAETAGDNSPAEAEEAAPQPPEPRQAPPQRGSRQGSFDLNRSLREIDSYVARLRSDLLQAQNAARRRDQPVERPRRHVAETGIDADELRRHNQQLEEQNQELRQRIEDLTSDHEDRAATLEISDSLEQFKTLVGLKLKEDFADYSAISREALNEVIRRHAHEILGHVFGVLKAEGVRFDRDGG